MSFIVQTEPPGAPRKPTEVSGMTDTTLTLAWVVPEKDGGSPIIEYVVEVRKSGAETWIQYGTTTVTNIFIEKLIKETSYEFRICARNDAGVGSALITEDMIVAGQKISKYFGGDGAEVIHIQCALLSLHASIAYSLLQIALGTGTGRNAV